MAPQTRNGAGPHHQPETHVKIGELFAGYGGLAMGVQQVLGGEIAWHSEIDPAASKILAHHWPHVPNHGDITAIDWAELEAVDILTGGWPCQPFSMAGKQKAQEDERALWPYVAGAVRALRPRYVILENVSAILFLGELARAVGDLAQIGYDARWVCVRASDVGAPHHRERCFILAYPEGERPVRQQQSSRGEAPQPGVDVRKSPLPDFGRYTAAVRTWERIVGPAPAPTETNRNGRPRLNAAFAEYLMGLPPGHVTAVPGISRADQLKAIGNGVCPQQAAAALTQLLEMETPS